jgi:hypothetical protein
LVNEPENYIYSSANIFSPLKVIPFWKGKNQPEAYQYAHSQDASECGIVNLYLFNQW